MEYVHFTIFGRSAIVRNIGFLVSYQQGTLLKYKKNKVQYLLINQTDGNRRWRDMIA